MEEQNDKKEETKELPKMSPLDEIKATLEQIKKEKAEYAEIRDELQKLRSDQLLSGTAGIRQEPTPPKEESSSDYMNKVMSGGLNERASTED